MVWRGAAFLTADGKTISPVDPTFALLGGGPYGAVGATGSWIVGLLGCAGILWVLWSGRSARLKHGFKPVSYTHLDVYKRQMLIRTTASPIPVSGAAKHRDASNVA